MIQGYLQTIRAEARKLLTVRSTYYVFLFMLALEGLFAFYIFGYHVSAKELATDGPTYLQQVVFNGTLFLAAFPAIVAILLVTHEYRHNTILYTLTASPSRLRVLLSKFKVASWYAIITTAFFGTLSVCLALLGTHLAHHHLVHQTFPLGQLIWKVVFYGWALTMIGFVIAVLVRNQVVAIVSILILPNIIEPILTLLLKGNGVYLPFAAASQILGSPTGNNPSLNGAHLSPGHAALVVLVYIVVGMIVGGVLFKRRSAL